MCVYVYVFMYVCMYVYIYIYISWDRIRFEIYVLKFVGSKCAPKSGPKVDQHCQEENLTAKTLVLLGQNWSF